MRVCERGRECGSGVRVWREQDMDVGVGVGVVWRGDVWRGGWDVSVCSA